MIASGFAAGTGGGKQVAEYLTEKKDREIAPELFKGDMALTRALIDSNKRRWTYTHGVLAFTADDAPTDEQLEEITQNFEDFMFAGKEPDTFNITFVKHQDKSRTELHFVVPRTDLETGQDLNIAPPGYEKDWAAWVASINSRYGFTDPFARPAKLTKDLNREHPSRKATREEINDWLEEQVAAGLIESRAHLTETLAKIGEVTRVNDKFISLKTDDAEKAFRLKGAIYETGFDFKAGSRPHRTLESERGKTGEGAGRATGSVPSGSASDRRPQNRDRAAEIERRRAEAYERRKKFFRELRSRSQKLRARDRKLRAARKEERHAHGVQIQRAAREDRHALQENGSARSGPLRGASDRAAHEPTPDGTPDWLVDTGRDGSRRRADDPDGLVDGPQSRGGSRRSPSQGGGAPGPHKGLPEPLRGNGGADRGQQADIHPPGRPGDGQSLPGGNALEPRQRIDRGVTADADSGPIAAAIERLGARERKLAENRRGTEQALRSHGRLHERVVQIGESAKRAVERIGRTLRNLVQKIADQSPPEPEPARPAPSAGPGP